MKNSKVKTSEYFKVRLKEVLKPLYKEMLSEITHEHICTFAAQWGEFFPKKENTGLLFVGKSVNGWVADSIDIEDIFVYLQLNRMQKANIYVFSDVLSAF